MPIINTDEPDFEQTMNHPEMLQAFEGYLAQEFSSENMAFLRALEDFQNNASNPNVSDAQLRQQVANIYDHYLKVGSARQVNLPAAYVKAMEFQLENLSTMNRQQMLDTLADANAEVNNLIRRDSFPRFGSTKEFKAAAEKVESNVDVEKQIEDLKEARRQALLNPSVSDRLKASAGRKTKAQELTAQLDTLQSELQASRLLKPLDVPPANMQTVLTSISQINVQHRAIDAQKAAEQEALKQARALKESQQQQQPDKGEGVDKDKEDLQKVQEQPMHGQENPPAPPRVGSPSVSSDPGDLEEPETPQFVIGDDGWPELEEQDGMELQPPQNQNQNENQMEVDVMSQEELDQLGLGESRARSQRVDEVDLGQTRGRSKGVDNVEVDVGQTRGRSRVIPEPPKPSVRDSLGHRDSQSKQGQGQGGPKVH